MGSGVRAGLIGVVVAAVLGVAGPASARGVAMAAAVSGPAAARVEVSEVGRGAIGRPGQVDTTVATAPTAPAAGTTVPGAVASSVPTSEGATDGSPETAVGDPAADRRIRRIVLALCGVAVAVLLVTLLFWRATRPVPRALQGLRELGSRSGRRRAAEGAGAVKGGAEADAVPPPAVGPAGGSGPDSPALVQATTATSLPDDG